MADSRNSEPRPHVACEITAERIIAARTHDRSSLAASSARTLPPGAVAPSLMTANVTDSAALGQAISDALATVGGRSRDVIAVLPDAAVRVVLLDFDTLPQKRADAEAVVRFRLKKSLPFDVDKAAVSFQATAENGAVRVMAAVALSSVLEEYESAIRAAGYHPGVVLPATIAALGALSTGAPALVIKVDAATTGVAIVEGGELILFRVLENGAGAAMDPERLAEEVYPSLVFFQDTYGRRVERILVGGIVGTEEVGAALQAHTGIRPQELVAASQAGSGTMPAPLLAGVTGALIG